MAETTNPVANPTVENTKTPTGKLGQPTTDTAIGRATGALAASQAIAENGPQITRPAVEFVTKSAEADTEAATQVALPFIEVYRDAARISAGHLQTLCDSWLSLGRGIRDIQVNWMETMGRTMAASGAKYDFWQVQRDLYVQGVDHMFDSAAQMVAITTKAMTPGRSL